LQECVSLTAVHIPVTILWVDFGFAEHLYQFWAGEEFFREQVRVRFFVPVRVPRCSLRCHASAMQRAGSCDAGKLEESHSIQSADRLGIPVTEDGRDSTLLARLPDAQSHLARCQASKLTQEMMRHANARITLELYAQITMPAKQALQAQLVSKWG